MEKLTLEHIAPYLPYGLKVLLEKDFHHPWQRTIGKHQTTSNCKYKKGDIIELDVHILEQHTVNNEFYNEYYKSLLKPILRPMNLTKPIKVDGKKVVPVVELCKMCYKEIYFPSDFDPFNLDELEMIIIGICSSIETMSLDIAKKLYEWKFDVDGLIAKGLAIDVNTLEVNPYN